LRVAFAAFSLYNATAINMDSPSATTDFVRVKLGKAFVDKAKETPGLAKTAATSRIAVTSGLAHDQMSYHVVAISATQPMDIYR